jgi:membrane protein required for colicin V production
MENLILAPLDIALLLVLLVGAWRGFVKGLVLSVASLVGLVGGIWAAGHFSHVVAHSLAQHVHWSVNTVHVASLALTFVLVVLAVHLLAKLIEKALDLVALGFANKVAGALFGVLKMGVILSFGMMLLNHVWGPRAWVPEAETPSVLLGPVETIAPVLTPVLNDLERPTLESGHSPDVPAAP